MGIEIIHNIGRSNKNNGLQAEGLHQGLKKRIYGVEGIVQENVGNLLNLLTIFKKNCQHKNNNVANSVGSLKLLGSNGLRKLCNMFGHCMSSISIFNSIRRHIAFSWRVQIVPMILTGRTMLFQLILNQEVHYIFREYVMCRRTLRWGDKKPEEKISQQNTPRSVIFSRTLTRKEYLRSTANGVVH